MPRERMFQRQVRLVSRDDESDGIDHRRSCRRSGRWPTWFVGLRLRRRCGNVEWIGGGGVAAPLEGLRRLSPWCFVGY